jgi:perosamine synthetase
MIGDAERAAAAAVLEGSVLTHGPRVKDFEAGFADFTGAPHAVATATCMAALHLASLAFELGPGDEVLVPAQTHVAGAHAVQVTGARPVFVDADERTGNMDLSLLEGLITERTKGISVVHYLGRPLDMGPVLALAERHGLFVVEDCAVALGATVEGTHVGLLGDIGCFSFYPVKHITTGEGGMIVTKHDEVAERVGKQRAFGIDKSVLADRRHTGAYEIELLGLNYRLGEVGAAIGGEQLKRLPEFLDARERNFDALYAGLSEVAGLAVLETGHEDGLRSSHYCLSAVLDDALGDVREGIIEELKRRGVGTSVYYPRSLPDTAYYRATYGFPERSCPEATRISTRSIAFPVGPHLQEGDIDFMISSVNDVMAEVR